jgi:hypothetical protein
MARGGAVAAWEVERITKMERRWQDQAVGGRPDKAI